MANRKRPIRVRTYLTEEELKMVHKRMAQMGTTNREACMRKMALDGYIIRLEIPELKEYVAMQKVHSKRFNEIAKRVNETELLDALEELLAHGYVRYQNNAYIVQEVM